MAQEANQTAGETGTKNTDAAPHERGSGTDKAASPGALSIQIDAKFLWGDKSESQSGCIVWAAHDPTEAKFRNQP